METGQAPNEFPFSSSAGTELLQVPLSYATSADGRQVVFTTMSSSPGGGGGVATPLHLMTDPGGLLDAFKQDAFVTVDTFDGFAAHTDTGAAVAARPTAVYQTGHEIPSSAELVHAVTELQLQQYIQHQQTPEQQHQHQQQIQHQLDSQQQQLDSQQQQLDSQHQQQQEVKHHRPSNQQQQQQRQQGHQEQQSLQQQQQQQQMKLEASEPASLVEITQRSSDTPCFLCDAPAGGGLVEIFGESNILAASKTPVCVKLECLLACPLAAEQVHSDALCLACLQLLETVDGVDFRLKDLECRSRELRGRVRRKFGRTVRGRRLNYTGWQLDQAEAEADAAPKAEIVKIDGGGSGGGGGSGEDSWSDRLASPPDSPGVITGDLSDPDDPDVPMAPAKAQTMATRRKKRTGTKARTKLVVADPRNPNRTKTKYIYDQSYACDVCGKMFAWQGHLAKHFQTHTGERPLHCHVCGQTFRWSSHLTSHLRRHNNDKPFVCNECGKSFVSGSVFKGHMRTHTDEKPFMCGVCGKQFRDKSNLRTHEWVHSDQRPHRCEPCDRGFLTTSALKVHNRTVHGATAAARRRKT